MYIDPPFASGADYAKKVYVRRNPKIAEVMEQAEEELDIDELKSFDEKMYGAILLAEKETDFLVKNMILFFGMSKVLHIYFMGKIRLLQLRGNRTPT